MGLDIIVVPQRRKQHSGAGIEVGEGLQRMCDSFPTRFKRKNMLERDVSCSIALEICCEIVHATRRRAISPTIMPNTAIGLAQRNHAAQPHHIHDLIGHCCPGKILGDSPETGNIDFAVQQGSQKVPHDLVLRENPQILREEVTIQIQRWSSAHEEIVGEFFTWCWRSLVRILKFSEGGVRPRS